MRHRKTKRSNRLNGLDSVAVRRHDWLVALGLEGLEGRCLPGSFLFSLFGLGAQSHVQQSNGDDVVRTAHDPFHDDQLRNKRRKSGTTVRDPWVLDQAESHSDVMRRAAHDAPQRVRSNNSNSSSSGAPERASKQDAPAGWTSDYLVGFGLDSLSDPLSDSNETPASTDHNLILYDRPDSASFGQGGGGGGGGGAGLAESAIISNFTSPATVGSSNDGRSDSSSSATSQSSFMPYQNDFNAGSGSGSGGPAVSTTTDSVVSTDQATSTADPVGSIPVSSIPATSTAEGEAPTTAACGFDLAGWSVSESGGTAVGRGNVEQESDSVLITEGDSFSVSMTKSFNISSNPSSISFQYSDLNFDRTDTDSIRDAFEVALLDQNSESLVYSFESGRDAFLNVTEGLPEAMGTGVVSVGGLVTLDVTDLPPNALANIVFRLVNNDGDTASSVRISCVTVASDPVAAFHWSPTDPAESGVVQFTEFPRSNCVLGLGFCWSGSE